MLFGAGMVFIVVVFSEFLWRTKRLRGERARKLVHIVVGMLVASWPWFMTFYQIQLLSLAMVVIVVLARMFNVFKGIYNVRRRTLGDVLFPFTIGILATLTSSKWVFAAALLHLGLADGMAAVVGDRAGKKNRYKVFGENRSVAGSLTFLVFSVMIMAGLVAFGPPEFGIFALPLITLVPLMATSAENLSVHGTDNIIVPLLIVVILNHVMRLGLVY